MAGKFYKTPQLKKIRLERDLTQEKLSRMCGLSYPVISRAENGYNIQRETLERITRALKISIEDLTQSDEQSA